MIFHHVAMTWHHVESTCCAAGKKFALRKKIFHIAKSYEQHIDF
jgi:hypothetical protein